MTGPVEEVRRCPWERLILPVDHDCIAAGEESPEPPAADETP